MGLAETHRQQAVIKPAPGEHLVMHFCMSLHVEGFHQLTVGIVEAVHIIFGTKAPQLVQHRSTGCTSRPILQHTSARVISQGTICTYSCTPSSNPSQQLRTQHDCIYTASPSKPAVSSGCSACCSRITCHHPLQTQQTACTCCKDSSGHCRMTSNWVSSANRKMLCTMW